MAKIAILIFYSGFIERGVENFVYELGKRLTKRHSIVIFQAGQSHRWYVNKIRTNRFKVVNVDIFLLYPQKIKNYLKKIYLDWWSIKILFFTLKLLPKLIRGKYDLIIPLNGGWQTAICRIFSKFTNSKILISGHAGIGSDDAINLLFRPDVFVALTSAQLKWAKRLVPEVKSVMIPNGVDLARFNPKVKSANVNLSKPIVVCASALVSYKRVDLTIRAIAKNKNLSLLVLGDGEERGKIDTLGKRLLSKRYFRILVPYDKIPFYYRACNVFPLASKTEAFGISYVEAMACNLPVVTTSDDSRAEIIGRAGILTDPAIIEKYAKDLE